MGAKHVTCYVGLPFLLWKEDNMQICFGEVPEELHCLQQEHQQYCLCTGCHYPHNSLEGAMVMIAMHVTG